MNYQPEQIWDAATWAETDEAVAEEVNRVGVARRALCIERVMAADGTAPSWVSGATVQDGGLLRIPEGDAHPFVEISAGFTLTGAQVENEATLHIGRTLARMAAKHVAGAEDAFILQGTGQAGLLGRPHQSVRVTNSGFVDRRGVVSAPVDDQVVVHLRPDGQSADEGQQEPPRDPDVEQPETERPDEDSNDGCAKRQCCCAAPTDASLLLTALTSAIARLMSKGWPDPYVLILGTDLYALASSQLVIGSTETPADRLVSHAKQVLLSNALSADSAVVVSLAGDATTIYMARDVSTAFVGASLDDDGGSYHFRVFERIQYALRAPLSIAHILP